MEAPLPDSDSEESGLCYCMGCRYASEYVNCCGFMPAPPQESAEICEVRRVWSEVHERVKIGVDRNAKNLPFSVDAAFNGTIICARDQVKDWLDEDDLFKKIMGSNTANLSKSDRGNFGHWSKSTRSSGRSRLVRYSPAPVTSSSYSWRDTAFAGLLPGRPSGG